MTKRQLKNKFWELVDGYRVDNNKLLKLYEEGRITYGFYLTHNLYDNYHYQELANKPIEKLTKWTIEYCLKELEKAMNELNQVVEEQENLPFEETQMQVLIKEGKIKWM